MPVVATTDRDEGQTLGQPGLDGRLVLVTGAAGDLGRAAALRSATSGAAVVLCDLSTSGEALRSTAELCSAANPHGAEPTEVHFDVTDEAAVQRAIESVVNAVGQPDAVFNNAGYQGLFTNLVDYPVEDFRTVMDVNVTGVFNVLKACSQAMLAAGRPGSIVNMASMASTGAPNMAAYSASKAAVIGLTKSAAKDLAHGGIRVNSISPAFIGPGMMWDRQVELQACVPSQYYADDPATVAEQMINQVPLRRYGTLDEVASTVEFLLSDAASYLTGINIEIAGGAS